MFRMLVIDDNIEFQTMVSCYFTDLGYKVGLAKDGREGLAQARAFKPDIILLDVMMPDIGGIEVIRELQSSEELRAIPVLIMTGTYFDRNMSELFKQESNCKEFLSKTMELSWVAKRVEALLEKK